MTGNQKCKSASHALHLCALKACGLDVEGNGVFTKLVDKPQFVCEACGDKANKAENLCKPKNIQA
jgi:hypothetical protein